MSSCPRCCVVCNLSGSLFLVRQNALEDELTDSWSHKIEEIRNNMIFNLGHGGEAAGKFILERVLAHQEGTADADVEKTGDAATDVDTTTIEGDADAADDDNVEKDSDLRA